MELSARVHDSLSDPRHGTLFSADLKHAYYSISLHPDDRHIFAFTIQGIGQLQPTRMPQGAKSAGFTINELVHRAFGAINNAGPKPSLLDSKEDDQLPTLTFYIDDFFGGFEDFEAQFQFLLNHFFPRIEWARVRLSFKKLKLFQQQLRALGVTHCIGGKVKIVDDRIQKITQFPEPASVSEVKSFLGTVSMTRRWVPNFAEIARPLSRLTGKVDWQWGNTESLSFEILRIKYATTAAMHSINLSLTSHFYVDASGFGAGLAITQVNQVEGSPKEIEVPIIYDSFTLSRTQRKYPTYKRELYALSKFAIKYDYLCKNPNLPTVINTDHKPLTFFCESGCHEGIYGYWADQLQRLHIKIVYIPGPRNKVADGLSRTIFRAENCDYEEPHI